MADTLFFLFTDPSDATGLASPLASKGFAIEVSSPSEPQVCDAIAESSPLAVVISLEDAGGCNAAREVAAGVLADARIPRPLMVFVGGSPQEIAATRAELPFGVFLNPDEVSRNLTHLAANV